MFLSSAYGIRTTCLCLQIISTYPNKMLKMLMLTCRARVGSVSQSITLMMRDFKPQNQQHIIQTLHQLENKKEYIVQSVLQEAFVNKIQYFLFKSQANASRSKFHIYQQLKKLSLLTSKFKYAFLYNLNKSFEKITNQDLNIKNNQLQVLLWFLYREYPLLRQTRFQQVGSDFTLKLFQMQEYMNKVTIMPTWEPYLRIVTMLQCLGHEPQLRKDLSYKTIQKIDYKYYPFLTSLFRSEQECRQFTEKQRIHEPILHNICNKYITADQLAYDRYLNHVQEIDALDIGIEIDQMMDPLSWNNFLQLFTLYAHACQFSSLDTDLTHLMNESFWRICETKNPDIETVVRVFEIVSQNVGFMGQHEGTIVGRTKEALEDTSLLDYKFLPSQGLIKLFKSVAMLAHFSEEQKKQLYAKLVNKVDSTIFWTTEQKNQLKQHFTDNNIQYNSACRAFLDSP